MNRCSGYCKNIPNRVRWSYWFTEEVSVTHTMFR